MRRTPFPLIEATLTRDELVALGTALAQAEAHEALVTVMGEKAGTVRRVVSRLE
jgi:hypothetical protein